MSYNDGEIIIEEIWDRLPSSGEGERGQSKRIYQKKKRIGFIGVVDASHLDFVILARRR